MVFLCWHIDIRRTQFFKNFIFKMHKLDGKSLYYYFATNKKLRLVKMLAKLEGSAGTDPGGVDGVATMNGYATMLATQTTHH